MNTLSESATWRHRLEAIRSTPPEAVVYCLFSISVGVADLWLTFVGPQYVKAMTVPFTGWSASMPYLFGLFFSFHLVFGPDRRFRHRLGMVAPLLIYMVSGLVEYALPRGQDFGNPYLQVSPWRPLWTIALPMFWSLLLLLSPVFRDRGIRPLRPLPEA
jgi:hypothetical protein